MGIIQAAIAIGTAVASAAAAAAPAVIAVSTVVGVAGIGVTVAGAITGNKDLLKAGKIMGFVGLAGGVAGGLAGGLGALAEGTGGFVEGAMGAYKAGGQMLTDAWDSTIGSLFAGGEPAAASDATVSAYNSGMDAAMGHGGAPVVETPAAQEAAGQAIVNNTPITPSDQLLNATAPMSGPSQQTLGQGIMESSLTGAPKAETPLAQQSLLANAGPAAPDVTTPSSDAVINASRGTFDQTAASGGALPGHAVGAGASAATGGGAGFNPAGFFDGLPDWVKYAAMTTGVQGLSGLASGYFQGLNAEQQLQFQKWVEQNRQNQLAVTNARGAYSPLVSFNRGTLNTGA